MKLGKELLKYENYKGVQLKNSFIFSMYLYPK